VGGVGFKGHNQNRERPGVTCELMQEWKKEKERLRKERGDGKGSWGSAKKALMKYYASRNEEVLEQSPDMLSCREKASGEVKLEGGGEGRGRGDRGRLNPRRGHQMTLFRTKLGSRLTDEE